MGRKNIQETLKYIKAEKIWLGVPAYGYMWSGTKKARAISAKSGIKLSKRYGFIRDKSGNMKIKYRKSGREILIFFSDNKMRSLMKELAARYKLAGTAMWRLGFED